MTQSATIPATGKILEALNHVREHFPEVNQVAYDDEYRWLFSNGNEQDAPNFEGKGIDVGLLEDASDDARALTVYTLPA